MTRIATFHPEYRPDGFALHVGSPRLSWTIESDSADVVQAGYELELATRRSTVTVRVDSAEQVLVPWPFGPLPSRGTAVVRVRVRTSDGAESAWSDPLALETALLDEGDWHEPFVSPSLSAPAEGVRPGYLLRAEFEVPTGVVRARVYATAHGIYSLALNGTRVGDQELAPGWTSYRHRLRFQTYDVTDQVSAGRNALGAHLSDGWYRGRIGFHGGVWDNYGTDLALLAQLELTLADGTVQHVPLGDSWRWSTGPVVATSLYDGETYDARLEPTGWLRTGFDDRGWAPATVVERERFAARIEPAIGVPVRVIEELLPQSVERRPDGRMRLDFGQNIAGRLVIETSAPAGTRIRLHHAEVLEDGELAIRPLRGAPSIDTYVTGPGGAQSWTPVSTIHGFRYAEIEGWEGELAEGAVRAQVIHSDMRRRGWFETDHPLLDRLHENTVWSMRDNFVDLPTDCPQRDERLGWTGDIQVFAPAASYLYDSAGTLASWMRDVAAEQGADGAVPNFVPWVECGFPRESAAAWGDAAVIVPWTMYQRNGDRRILEEQFESMTLWVDHSAAKRGESGLILEGMQLGDWLDPSAPPEDPGAGITDAFLVANAYLVESARLVASVADVIGKRAEAQRYRDLSERTASAFRARYVLPDGTLTNESPTALALCLVLGLLDTEPLRIAAGKRLARLVRDGSYRVQTGFVGTPIICDALASTGQIDVAYRLLTETANPSWLYPVTMGATTIWERWDSMLPDGSVNPGEMTSFNHYAFGAVVDFLHRVVAGLAPAAPGYRKLHIAPRPSSVLSRASAVLDTPYGRASSGWERDGDVIRLDVVVPVGVTATVQLPGEATASEVGSGQHSYVFAADISGSDEEALAQAG